MSKTVCDKLRAHLLSQGIEGVPKSNATLFDILQEHGIAQPTLTGRAISKATVMSAAGWTHSFTFLRVSPALIWDIETRPPAFQGTVTVDPEAPGREANAVDDREQPPTHSELVDSLIQPEIPATDRIPQVDFSAVGRDDRTQEIDDAGLYSAESVAASDVSFRTHEASVPAPEHQTSC